MTVTSSTTLQTTSTGDTRFFYDDNQNRVKMINQAGDVFYFVYDPTASIPAVVYEQGDEARYLNIREPDGSLASRVKYNASGEKQYERTYHFDGSGSTMALTDANGDVTDTYTYDAWGKVTSHVDPDPNDGVGLTNDNPYQYVGQLGYYTHWQEQDFDLLQLGVRYYDPGFGRFVSRDPVPIERESVYSYVYGQPTVLADPSGRIVPVVLAAAVTVYRGVCAGMSAGHALCALWSAYKCTKCVERSYDTYKWVAEQLDDENKFAEWMIKSKPYSECSDICALAAASTAKAIIWNGLMRLVKLAPHK